MRNTATRGSTTSGEPSSITGSRLSAGVFQSEMQIDVLDQRRHDGSRIGIQNRIAAMRRSSRGKKPSASARRDGRAKSSTSAIAIAA